MTREQSGERESRGSTPRSRSGSGSGQTQSGSGSTSGSVSGSSTTTSSTASTPTRPTGLRASPGPLLSRLFRRRSRSRSQHGHRHPHRRSRPGCHLKRRESNFPSAVCNMLVMVLLCTAMVEPEWFYVRGGGCHDAEGGAVHYIGISKFFYLGHFIDSVGPQKLDDQIVYNYGSSPSDILVNCVSPGSVEILRSIIALCFVAIIFALVAFLLDLIGPSGSIYKILHRNAVFSILTVVTCVTINGFSYWVASRLDHLQHVTKPHKGSRVEVQFSISFYLVAAAGAVAVISTACNLLRRHPPAGYQDDRELLVSDGPDLDYPGISGPESGDAPPEYTP